MTVSVLKQFACGIRLRKPIMVSGLWFWVIDALMRTRQELDVALWAYVIMPEHVHLLLHPRAPEYEMRRILALLKQPVAKAARKWLEENRQTAWLQTLTVVYPSRSIFRFWHPGGGFDHNVFRAPNTMVFRVFDGKSEYSRS